MADIRRLRRRLGINFRLPRVIPDRQNPLEDLSRDEVKKRYRFSPESIVDIVRLIEDDVRNPTEKAGSIPPLLMVLVTLRFLATGTFQLVVGDLLQISQSAVSVILTKVCSAFASKANRFINFPRERDAERVRRNLHEVAGFPGCLGIIDGTLIRIQAPTHHEAAYVCRKNYHAINCQVVCNDKLQITNVVARWPGSTHDSRIFRQSNLCNEFETGQHEGHLIGDSGYGLRPFLLTPFLNPNTPQQIQYNRSLKVTRSLVEQAIGILKRRFPCLHLELRFTPAKCSNVFVTCVMLNNIALDRQEILPDEIQHVQLQANDDQAPPPNLAAARVRDLFANTYFA